MWVPKRNFVKGACWENSCLQTAVGILDLDWWVSTHVSQEGWVHVFGVCRCAGMLQVGGRLSVTMPACQGQGIITAPSSLPLSHCYQLRIEVFLSAMPHQHPPVRLCVNNASKSGFLFTLQGCLCRSLQRKDQGIKGWWQRWNKN